MNKHAQFFKADAWRIGGRRYEEYNVKRFNLCSDLVY